MPVPRRGKAPRQWSTEWSGEAGGLNNSAMTQVSVMQQRADGAGTNAAGTANSSARWLRMVPQGGQQVVGPQDQTHRLANKPSLRTGWPYRWGREPHHARYQAMPPLQPRMQK